VFYNFFLQTHKENWNMLSRIYKSGRPVSGEMWVRTMIMLGETVLMGSCGTTVPVSHHLTLQNQPVEVTRINAQWTEEDNFKVRSLKIGKKKEYQI
jgi:hypothetical protein